MNPQMIQAGLGLVSGLGSLFGKKKKSKAQMMMEADAAKERELKSGLLKEAMGYDQGAINNNLIAEIQARTGHALDNSNAKLIGNAARGGVSMGGDTAFLVNRQQDINSIMNPMSMQIAQMRADEAKQNLSVKMNALSQLGPGTNRYVSEQPGNDQGQGLGQLAGGIDGIISGVQGNKDATKKKKVKYAADIAGTLAGQFGRW